MGIWDIVIWAGAALTVAGLIGLVWCILAVIRARRSGISDEEMRLKLRGALAMNMAALMASGLGLMTVILGIAMG